MGRLRFLTAGESHGPTLGVTLEGVPAGLPISADALAIDLARRQRGYGRGARQAIEHDRAEIVAGVRHGLTLGSPILLMVANRDFENWTRVMQVEALSGDEAKELAALVEGGNKKATPVTRVRPGHADLAGALKYGFGDVRNVLERASARETAARVAAGGVARLLLRELGVEVWSFTAEVGGVALDPANSTRSRDEADESPLRCPDPDAEAAMIARIDEARSNGDTVGGVFEVVAHDLPIGLGSYVQWDRRLDAALAAAVMSINIVKGVEFGLGFEQTRRFGSGVHDVIEGRDPDGHWVHRSNHAGGLTGRVRHHGLENADRLARCAVRGRDDGDGRATGGRGPERRVRTRHRGRRGVVGVGDAAVEGAQPDPGQRPLVQGQVDRLVQSRGDRGADRSLQVVPVQCRRDGHLGDHVGLGAPLREAALGARVLLVAHQNGTERRHRDQAGRGVHKEQARAPTGALAPPSLHAPPIGR